MSAWNRAGRSLRGRWMVALLAVFVLLVILVSVAIRASTARAFEEYVVAQAFSGMQDSVEEYVRETGSLRGFVPRGRRAKGMATAPPRSPSAVGAGPLAPEHRASAQPSPAAPGRPRPQRPLPPRGQPDPPGGGPPGLQQAQGPVLEQPPRPGAARVPGLRGNGRVPIRFGLADEDGRLVLPMEGADVGTVLPREVLATGQPMLVDEQRVGTVFIPEEPFGDDDPFPEGSPEVAFLRTTSRATIAALGSGMLVALGLVWMLAGRIVRPLQELTAASQAMAAGDLRQSVGAETDDEVGRLAAAFNAMSAKLSEATALRRQMTADVAHDLRTPLAAVIAMLEAMRDGALPATPERLAAAHAEADRLGRLVGDLHTLALADAREVPIHRATVHPPDVLRQLALANEATATRDGLTLTVCETTAPAVFADHDRLVQAVGNLVSNAMRHTPPGGTVQLNARAERGGVAFLVTDTGVGIPPDLLPRVFERSVRGDTARSGEGSGLGLPITRALAEAMGGRAGIASPPGSGTTAWLWLPTATQNDRAALPRS